ncbi:MAG: Cu(I)-responsive transcriptional regulator [Rhodobacteraceae bacterium]|nr:Cu(I)-responsive transcriptional regulator [Paracoccaceae bacterium]
MLNIGSAARATGLPTKTVRYYADIGLVAPGGRSEKGYRLYDDRELRKLVFVRRARAFGFSVESCRTLLGLYEDQNRTSADVKKVTLNHIEQIDRKLAELKILREELAHLAGNCKGDDRPDCPILSSLAGER